MGKTLPYGGCRRARALYKIGWTDRAGCDERCPSTGRVVAACRLASWPGWRTACVDVRSTTPARCAVAVRTPAMPRACRRAGCTSPRPRAPSTCRPAPTASTAAAATSTDDAWRETGQRLQRRRRRRRNTSRVECGHFVVAARNSLCSYNTAHDTHTSTAVLTNGHTRHVPRAPGFFFLFLRGPQLAVVK